MSAPALTTWHPASQRVTLSPFSDQCLGSSPRPQKRFDTATMRINIALFAAYTSAALAQNCGPLYDRTICAESTECCSQYGWCANDSAHCDPATCLKEYSGKDSSCYKDSETTTLSTKTSTTSHSSSTSHTVTSSSSTHSSISSTTHTSASPTSTHSTTVKSSTSFMSKTKEDVCAAPYANGSSVIRIYSAQY